MSAFPDKDVIAPATPWGVTLFGVASAAFAYVVFFDVNAWLFSTFKVSENISWVFLPAAIRMIAVLLAGWAGVAGLFIGSLAVDVPKFLADPAHALTLATLSSVPSIFAAQAVRHVLKIPGDLRGMTGRDLLCFGLAGGLANSAAHTVYFIARAGHQEPISGFVPMFVGDTIGMLLMLYVGALGLRHVRLPQR